MAKSRYSQTPTIRDPASYEPVHYGQFNLPEEYRGIFVKDIIQQGDQYDEHVWQMGDRVDILANKYYGDDKLWWIICLTNNISYPLGISIGTVLRIPTDARTILERLKII